MYVPYTFSMGEGTEILVRSEVPPLTLQHAVREQLRVSLMRNQFPEDPLTNANIAELLATAAEDMVSPLNRAYRRASRKALLWTQEVSVYIPGWPHTD